MATEGVVQLQLLPVQAFGPPSGCSLGVVGSETEGVPLEAHTLGRRDNASCRAFPTQVKSVCELIFDVELPEPELDPAAFVDAVGVAQAAAGDQFDPVTREKRPWIDLGKLAAHIDA